MLMSLAAFPTINDVEPRITTTRTVVILTALSVELEAVREHLDSPRPCAHPAGTVFEIGHLHGTDRRIAVAVVGEGNVGAGVLTERAIAMFRPAALLFVGVAGALSDDVNLGDVVVATRVYGYHGGREGADGFLPRTRCWDAPHRLEQVARLVARVDAWRGLLPDGGRECRPMVHFKPVAAGEVVLDSRVSPLARRLRDQCQDAVAIEMESAGVAHAAHLNGSLPALIIRGVSDRANGGKMHADRAGWPRVAARNAAAFALTLINALP
jgi:nucleoside phosphorylase